MNRLGSPPVRDQAGELSDLGDFAGEAAVFDPPILDRLCGQFASLIHQSLIPAEVELTAVHEMRPLLSCERVCFLARRRNQYRLVAVSGQRGRPPRSQLVSRLEQVVSAVAPAGERFLFPTEEHELPEFLGRALSDYWECANSQMILIEPVFSQVANREAKSETRQIVGALVIEQFGSSQLAPGSLERLDFATEHFSLALSNARRYSRLLAVPGLRPLGFFFALIRGSRLATGLIGLAMLSAFIGCISWVEAPFELECRGRLMPAVRREAYAPVDGEIVDVEVDESENVHEGQVLARLRSRELDAALLEQTGLLRNKLKSRDAARAELQNTPIQQTRGQSARNQAQLEVLHSEIDNIKQHMALIERERRQLEISSPLAGTITTSRPHDTLIGRPVRRGEPLLEIVDETGPWRLELLISERKLGYLLAFRQSHPAPRVAFRLHSSMRQRLSTTVSSIADRSIPDDELGAAGLIYCEASDVDLPLRRMGTEVSARIHCGKRSLGFLWLHEFRDMLQRHWWL